MDSPHRPEASSPVVLQRPNIPNERTQVVSNRGRRTIASPFRTLLPVSTGGVTTSARMPSSASSSVLGTTSAIPTVGTGRATRSRRRSTRFASAGFAPVPLASAASMRTQSTSRGRPAASTSNTVPASRRSTRPASVGIAGFPFATSMMRQSRTRERSAASASATVPASTAAPSRKRKASSSLNERRRKSPKTTGSQKKPPPGADLKKPPPQAGKSKKDEDKKPPPKCDCCICMEAVEPKDVAKIDGCDHLFCFGCIEKWSERENKCPLCKARFNRIERIQKKYKKGCKNTKKVKQRDQRSDISSGVALEGLLRKFLSSFE